ncbi:MAG: hypothetical protein IJU71_04365 [Selenomonadaceae bacterium]|nr:hypothetical protein [Selenomonadaceae bacterium]
MRGYIRTLINYLKTPKGRHDAIDYARALAIIASTAAAIGAVIAMSGE